MQLMKANDQQLASCKLHQGTFLFKNRQVLYTPNLFHQLTHLSPSQKYTQTHRGQVGEQAGMQGTNEEHSRRTGIPGFVLHTLKLQHQTSLFRITEHKHLTSCTHTVCLVYSCNQSYLKLTLPGTIYMITKFKQLEKSTFTQKTSALHVFSALKSYYTNEFNCLCTRFNYLNMETKIPAL